MLYFIGSILCSAGIFVVFKSFQRLGIYTFPAIVINYWMAFAFGYALSSDAPWSAISSYSWAPLAILQGVLFITIFYVMARTVQVHGITVGSVASRTAMILPAIVFMFLDPLIEFSWSRMAAVALAVVAVVLSSLKKERAQMDSHEIWLPIVLFIGSGIIDLILGYAESFMMHDASESMMFVPLIFAVAGILGTLRLLTIRKSGNVRLGRKEILGGVILGVVNYGSLYFILKALGTGLLDPSAFFPVNNIGIVALGTLVGVMMFREQLDKRNWLGLGLAVISILLLIQVGIA